MMRLGRWASDGRVIGKRSLAKVLAAVVIVASCSSATPSPTPAPTNPNGEWEATTAWEKTLARIQPDGSVDLDTALTAFSLAIAPLPGVTLPPEDAGRITDGSEAVRWLRSHWDELTDEQRLEAQRHLVPPGRPGAVGLVSPDRSGTLAIPAGLALVQPIGDRGPAGYAAGFGRTLETVTLAVTATTAAITAHLGRPVTIPVKPWVNTVETQVKGAAALAYTSVVDSNGLSKGAATDCYIYINPSGMAGDDTVFTETVAHEVFHCFQGTFFDVLSRNTNLTANPWVIEGSAEWVGDTIGKELTGGSSGEPAGWWTQYLKSPETSLMTRSYDAIGFFARIEERGQDPWPILDDVVVAGSGPKSYLRATEWTSQPFADSWASGYFRDGPSRPDWDIGQGVGLPADVAPTPVTIPITNGGALPIDAKAYTNQLWLINGSADIARFHISGSARLIDIIGTEHVGFDGVGADFCINGPCVCPPGMHFTSDPPSPLETPIRVAVSGGTDGALGSIVGVSLDDVCAPDELKGGPNPCAKGCAGSVGDPHLKTIDMGKYDFQAAGEYELLRSPDGSVEIQARQAAYPEIADVSINTGLAWRVNGHRITMYPQDETFVVRLDGTDVNPLGGTIDLGEGAALTVLRLGVEVAFSDGTITTAFFHGNGFVDALDVQIAPSDSLRSQGVGLLGPIAAGSELPAMPDGSMLPLSTDRATRYEQRYLQLGPAWHVTDQTSLFDYGEGESTATFDQPGFPSPDVAFDVEELKARDGFQAFQDAADKCAGVIADQEEYLHCIFDVMATKDPAYAEFYKLVLEFLANGPMTLEQTGPTVTPQPTATPTSTLPQGFFEVEGATVVNGAAVDADGTAFVSVTNADQTYSLLALDPASGVVSRSISLSGGGHVLLLEGSVWAAQSDPTGYGNCSVLRLDPATLETSATIPVSCSFFAEPVAVQDGLWWVDRSTSDADGHGALLRHVDPTTNQVDRSVALPFVNGYLSSSATTVFYGDSGAGNGWYRLIPGATALQLMPGVDTPFYPSGEGAWFGDAFAGTASFFTAGQSPDTVLAVDGGLVAADEISVYTSKSGTEDELWRYPSDGSAPSLIATATTLETDRGAQKLYYSGNGGTLFIGEGHVAALWTAYGLNQDQTATVIIQFAPLP